MAIFRSASCAADILEAWRENDREQLNRRLAKDATTDFDPNGNAYECERLELLDGIATQLRCSIASGHAQDANVYIPLLQHLAQSAGTLSDRNYVQ